MGQNWYEQLCNQARLDHAQARKSIEKISGMIEAMEKKVSPVARREKTTPINGREKTALALKIVGVIRQEIDLEKLAGGLFKKM